MSYAIFFTLIESAVQKTPYGKSIVVFRCVTALSGFKLNFPEFSFRMISDPPPESK